MTRLEPPVKRYLTGKHPSHSSSQSLHLNFNDMDATALRFILNKYGCMSAEGKPTKKAVEAGLIDICEKNAIWNIDNVMELLKKAGYPVTRKAVNQNKPEKKFDEPEYVNLGTIGMYFSVSANKVGQWLDALGLRDEKTKLGTEHAQRSGLCQISEMSAGPGQGNKKRKITVWDLHLIIDLLMEHGHELDYSYEQTMKGKGKNSDVNVVTIESRTKEFIAEFTRRFKSDNPQIKKTTIKYVLATPKPILIKAEEMMGRQGFFTKNEYQKYLRGLN